jgi:hypothetical protein
MSTDGPDFWSDVQAVFAAAMEVDPSERASIVRERCANRPELRAEVESLLAPTTGGLVLASGDPDGRPATISRERRWARSA